MRIAVIGAGAAGSAIAADLARAGQDVTLAARGQRLAQLRAGPLRLETGGQVHSVDVTTVSTAELSGPVDLAILCVKTPDLEGALAALADKIGQDGVVLTVQNGVEAHEIAARCLPGTAIVAGRLHGFFEMEDDLVRHVGVPPSIQFGCTAGDANTAHACIGRAFGGSMMVVEPTADIVLALWEKFLIAASLGSVASALGIPAGQVCARPEGAELLGAAMDDVVTLARAQGIALTQAHVDATLAFIKTFPPEATTSLQRDIEAGRPSEYDALTGAVSRLARRQELSLNAFPRLEAMIAARNPH